jgi:hypothetical protein
MKRALCSGSRDRRAIEKPCCMDLKFGPFKNIAERHTTRSFRSIIGTKLQGRINGDILKALQTAELNINMMTYIQN